VANVHQIFCLHINKLSSFLNVRLSKSKGPRNLIWKEFFKYQTSASRRGFFVLQVHKTAEQINLNLYILLHKNQESLDRLRNYEYVSKPAISIAA